MRERERVEDRRPLPRLLGVEANSRCSSPCPAGLRLASGSLDLLQAEQRFFSVALGESDAVTSEASRAKGNFTRAGAMTSLA